MRLTTGPSHCFTSMCPGDGSGNESGDLGSSGSSISEPSSTLLGGESHPTFIALSVSGEYDITVFTPTLTLTPSPSSFTFTSTSSLPNDSSVGATVLLTPPRSASPIALAKRSKSIFPLASDPRRSGSATHRLSAREMAAWSTSTSHAVSTPRMSSSDSAPTWDASRDSNDRRSASASGLLAGPGVSLRVNCATVTASAPSAISAKSASASAGSTAPRPTDLSAF
mmetsp:Transcript_11924/g.51346  ORF Transcript_11924/g.51346 Transcript_11924/m.51346 type:complete len:225 (-) Transcript_11924:1920-2594(-)